MIESIIWAGTGLLVGSLLFVGFIPMVHARAVRLTRHRLKAMTPMSMAAVNADKDRLRAEFAVTTRRLELSVERMLAKASGQLATLGKKCEAVGRLRLEHGKAVAAALAAEARRKALADQLESTKSELAARTETLQVAERSLADTAGALVKAASDLRESAMMSSCGRIELVVLRARREVLKSQIERNGQEIDDLRLRIEAERAMGAAAALELAEERSKTEAFGARIAELERHLTVQSIETEILTRRVGELDRRFAEQPGPLAEREPASEVREPAAVRRIETLGIPGRVGPDEAALASRERSRLLVKFRKALATGAWHRIRRSLDRGLPETRLAANG
jgi:chromosome segregation ATPase